MAFCLCKRFCFTHCTRMFGNEITLLHFLVLPVSLGSLRVGLDFYQKLVDWLYNTFFALTAQAKITWRGYLIILSVMNLFVVFSSTASCLATIPLDQGNSTAVAFIVMLNFPLSSRKTSMLNSRPLSDNIVLVAPVCKQSVPFPFTWQMTQHNI